VNRIVWNCRLLQNLVIIYELGRTGVWFLSVNIWICSRPDNNILWLSSIVDPGVNLALLSRVMSSRLSRGTYNGGLLSTEAGTIARVIADGTITLGGYLGDSRLLNATLLPSLLICISSILATFYTYNSLYWFVTKINQVYPCNAIPVPPLISSISLLFCLPCIIVLYCKKTSSLIFF